MTVLRLTFVGAALGVVAGALILILGIDALGPASSTAVNEPQDAKYVVFATDATLELIERDAITEQLALTVIDEPDHVRAEVIESDADGLILDRERWEELPEGTLSTLFASGRVLVVFDVEKQDVLRAAESERAFPDADRDFIPDVTLNPGSPTGAYTEPFYSLIFRSRPSGGNIYGGETTREFEPNLFAQMLYERALNTRGLLPKPSPIDEGE